MFRRRPDTLPPDPVFEPELKKLGFFINEHDQIRMIKNREAKYSFSINKNDRVNYAYREASNAAIYAIVRERLEKRDFDMVRLPLGATKDEKHIPIVVSKSIASRDRVIVLFGERSLPPGILSWRILGDEGINVGSVVDFVTSAVTGPSPSPEHSAPGIIIANPSQLLWYRGGGRAVSDSEWLHLPRATAVSEPMKFDPVKNRVPGNETFEAHVQFMFEEVLSKLVHKDASIDIVGAEFPGSAVVDYLASHWDKWSKRITGIALVAPQHKIQDLIATDAPADFVNFLSLRARAYFVSPQKLERPMAGRKEFGCNCYASGEEFYQENAIVRSWKSILDWFNRLYADPDFEEVPFDGDDGGEGAEEVKLGW
ncbi:hypothetical protein PV08_05338 [Exophiala spinifera]|uniref:Arb2 domain-containing protein n=1 Tax=Exophiala spinifera TaxID=91928 RepID=A0A0D2B8M2_9EURO|nr:uncharacterized protein PV08_05338 [Exophiala spinifera]KIW15293.1 hypothetical protein PV08_05338 [Exophiala spinifera]